MTRGGLLRGLVAPALIAVTALSPVAAPGVPLVAPGTAAGPPVRVALPPSRDPVGAGALTVRIDTISPSVPGADDTLTLRGEITNTSAEPVTGVAALLRLSPTPLVNRGEIAEVLAGQGARTGEPVAGTRTDLDDRLEPGASVPFTLSAAVEDLGLGSPGAYVTGVEALGDAGTGVVRQDIDRTFLPWWPPGTTLPTLLLTTLWPLTGPPQQDAEGILLSEEPAVQMSPAGRLDTLVAAAASQPGAVSLVVDPQAVQVASDMSDGYEVLTDSGTSPGTRAGEVAQWLDDVRTAVADPVADPAAMLYGQPDVVAAVQGRVLAATLRQRPDIDAATEEALGVALPATVALLPGGVLDQPTADRLARAGLAATVLSDRALPLATPTYFTPSGSVVLETGEGPLPALLTDSGLSAALAMPLGSSAERTAAQQRLLAETLTTVAELPETQRLLVAAPEPGWSPPAEGARMIVETLASTPWIEPTGLASALAREPSTLARSPLVYSAADVEAQLPADQVDDVRDQFDGLAAYRQILADPDDLPLSATTAPTRGLSSWWRNHPEEADDLIDRVNAQVRAATGSVRVVSSGSITVSGSSGTIPVTVENLGTRPVRVGLELTSDPPQLFVADPIEPFRIEPGTRTSLEVTAQVAAAGPVPVTVQLTTAEGLPFGIPGELVVQSSAYADAARILVRAALAALLLAVVVHAVRRARRRRAAGGAHAPASDQATEVVGG